jgi:hypothetical protein
MRTKINYLVVLVLLVVTFPFPAKAAQLRGRLDRVDQYGRRSPVAGISVTVLQAGRRSAAAVTNAQGMYYLSVPAGSYWLEVWVANPPKAYQISVSEPNTDIPPIVVR